MQTSQRGLDLIKEFEGLELEAYLDAVDIWTIGYGHTSKAGPPEVKPGMEITQDEAERILRRDLRKFERDVEKAFKVELTQNMFDALVSITYNIGPGNMNRSTFKRLINQGDYEGGADSMLLWNKAGGRVLRGLQRRREAERALFLDGFDGDFDAGDDLRGLAVEESSGRRSNLLKSRTMGGAASTGTAGAAAAGAAIFDGDRSGGSDAGSATAPPASTPAPQTPAPNRPAPEPEDPQSDGSNPDDESEAEDTAPTTPPEPEQVPQQTPETDAPVPAEDDQTELETGTEEPSDKLFVTAFDDRDEMSDAIIVAAGALAVLSAIWVAAVRFDDWRNHRR